MLDLSTFWAGAYPTCYLGALGADIVKVESIQRPDGHRYSGAWSFEGERWYEIAQIEVAACVAAEPVIENSMNGVVRPREGNRFRGYLQGVYPAAAEDSWVALSVRNDADWAQLLQAMGAPTSSQTPDSPRWNNVNSRTTISTASLPTGRAPGRPEKSLTPLSHGVFRPRRC